MFGNALKELESQYQEERSEFKARPQARKKGYIIRIQRKATFMNKCKLSYVPIKYRI